jgi:hypothetical protein
MDGKMQEVKEHNEASDVEELEDHGLDPDQIEEIKRSRPRLERSLGKKLSLVRAASLLGYLETRDEDY